MSYKIRLSPQPWVPLHVDAGHWSLLEEVPVSSLPPGGFTSWMTRILWVPGERPERLFIKQDWWKEVILHYRLYDAKINHVVKSCLWHQLGRLLHILTPLHTERSRDYCFIRGPCCCLSWLSRWLKWHVLYQKRFSFVQHNVPTQHLTWFLHTKPNMRE